MKLTHLTACAAAFALMGAGAAFAQTPAAEQPPAPVQTTPVTAAPEIATTTTSSADGTTTTAVAATDVATGVSVTVSTTTNGPVPDTAENRRKYGQPISRAGKRTAARGN